MTQTYKERIEELEEHEERLWRIALERGSVPRAHRIVIARIYWEHRDWIYSRARQRGNMRLITGGNESDDHGDGDDSRRQRLHPLS